MRAAGASILGVVGAVAAVTGIGCRAREDAFYGKVFSCEGNAGEDSCGTSRHGGPMTCFAASQLGGRNFCVEACIPTRGSDDPRFVCLSSGALLQTCHPRAGAGDPSLGCPAGLACYRTDLLLDQGVCIQMDVCAEDSHCSEKRPVCAGRLIRERTSSSFPIQADNLQCVQSMCGAGRAMCPSGESCLAGFYETSLEADYDICVPTCDGSLQCPPNFACAFSRAASGSPLLCLPGVPGIRCRQDQDCAAGTCVDTGSGFNMCVLPLPCRSNQDCAALNGTVSTFFCGEVPGAGRRCLLRQTFNGANCADAADCPPGFICTFRTWFGAQDSHGECRLACGADGSCPARSGIPHICVAGGQGGCYPTDFGVPCASSADCVPELPCLPVGPDARSPVESPTVCTTTCVEDGDCKGNPLIRVAGFCRQDEGVCRMTGLEGAPCERDGQCAVSPCVMDLDGRGRCGG